MVRGESMNEKEYGKSYCKICGKEISSCELCEKCADELKSV